MSDSGGTKDDPPEHPPSDSTWGLGPPSEPTVPGQQHGAPGGDPEHPNRFPGPAGGSGPPGGYGQPPGGYPGQPGTYPGQSVGYGQAPGTYPGQPGGYGPSPGGYGQPGGGYNPQGTWPGQQPPVWQMGPGYATTQTSGKAIAALVCSIGSVFLVPIILSIIGFVLGLVGRNDINRSGGRLGGNGMCLAAIIISVVSFVGWVFIIIAIVVAAHNATTTDYTYNSLHALMAPLIH